ncbi:MAG: hypothetical protein LBK66_06615 [Spirochaetaceae bacterium]|jgi:hypothetical protein|nr:hypothetical protein [Spirochaetaceae bacterium]
MAAEDIAVNIDAAPLGKQTAGQKFTPPRGKPLDHVINKKTFVVYELPLSDDDELEYVIEQANAFLLRHKRFLKEFYTVGGTVCCCITIISKKHYVFNLSPELIRETSELGAELEVQVYAEEEDEEDADCQSKAE